MLLNALYGNVFFKKKISQIAFEGQGTNNTKICEVKSKNFQENEKTSYGLGENMYKRYI